jgi:hypothetical protein
MKRSWAGSQSMLERLRILAREPWWATQRRIDIMILWPSCKAAARERGLREEQVVRVARSAFYVHAGVDPAWNYLGVARIQAIVEALT